MSEKWYKQSNEQGHVFFDKYIHPDCDLIKQQKSSWEWRQTRKWSIRFDHPSNQ